MSKKTKTPQKVRYRKIKASHGLFGAEFRQRELEARDLPLQKLSKSIDFESFRALLEERCNYSAGTAWDVVLMFKILLLQRYYDLSEEQTELQILDRLSFQAFLGMGLEDKVPDKNTIWDFKERLGEQGISAAFALFDQKLASEGLVGKGGKIVDASFVEVPRQRNNREENQQIKQGKPPEDWTEKKRAHKDTDARWTKKNNETHFGYKNHIKVNSETKLIEQQIITPASTHDSQAMPELANAHDQSIHADSAYTGESIEKGLKTKDIEAHICEKGKRNSPLTKEQKAANKEKSRTRSRVEHIFGIQRKAFRSNDIRTIGIQRATRQITLTNLLYNLTRYTYLQRRIAPA